MQVLSNNKTTNTFAYSNCHPDYESNPISFTLKLLSERLGCVFLFFTKHGSNFRIWNQIRFQYFTNFSFFWTSLTNCPGSYSPGGEEEFFFARKKNTMDYRCMCSFKPIKKDFFNIYALWHCNSCLLNAKNRSKIVWNYGPHLFQPTDQSTWTCKLCTPVVLTS